MDGAPWDRGLADYAARLRAGTVTAAQAVEHCLERIEAHDGKHRAFVHLDRERALEAAQAADRAVKAGRDPGPLTGVPVAIKDLFSVEGMPTRAGSRLDLSRIIGPEGPFVRDLKAKGAVILGKTRTIEFAAGAHNVGHPTPWNPADPARHRSPGGSSSGSAVAVAAGFCPLAVGTDTGGSVRVPAALCGVVGYKSTYGLLPLEGIFPLCPAMDSIGFFARSAADMAFAVDGFLDPAAPSGGESALGDLRIGVPPDHLLAGLEDAVARAWETALKAVEAGGARLVQVDWPDAAETETIAAIFSGLVPADLIATLTRDGIERGRDSIDPVALDRIGRAFETTDADRDALRAERQRLSALALRRLEGLDALVQPTAPICAPPVDTLAAVEGGVAFTARALALSRHANVYGLCAVSLPIATAPSLPVGLDVAAAPGSDRRLLRLARAVAEAL